MCWAAERKIEIVWHVGLMRQLDSWGKVTLFLKLDGGAYISYCVFSWGVHSHELGVTIGIATQSIQQIRDVNVYTHS
jgi:hypothetical protein